MENEDKQKQENLKNSNDSFQTKTYINDNEHNNFPVEHLKKGIFFPLRQETAYSQYVVPRIVGIIVVFVIGCSGILSDINLNVQIFFSVFIVIVLSRSDLPIRHIIFLC